MKKKIIFIFLLFAITWIYNPHAEAGIMPDNPQDYYSFYNLDNTKRFNIIKGNTSVNISDQTPWVLFSEDLTYLIDEGILRFDGEIISSKASAEFDLFAYYKNSEFIKYEAYLKDELIYQVTCSNYSPTIVLSKEADLYSIIGYDSDNFYYEMSVIPYYVDFPFQPDTSHIEDVCEEIFSEGCPFILAGAYLLNSGYNDKEIHIVTATESLLSYNDIIDLVIVNDETDGEDCEVSIIDTNYYPDEKVSTGEYYLKLRVSDKSGNIIIQQCIIDVTDATKPVLSSKPVEYNYWFKSNHAFIKQAVTVDDESECTKEVIYDEYTSNYNVVGTYKVTVLVTDSFGNYDECDVEVNVVDYDPPNIVLQKDVNITTLDDLNKEDLKQYIHVVDDCYGEIDEYEIKDLNGYLNDTRRAGEYKFLITATDGSGRTGSGRLTICVHDEDYPTISFNEYVIITQIGTKLSHKQMLDILIKTGQIKNDNVTVSTSYEFYDREDQDYNEEGSYFLKIIDENGNEFNNTIEVNAKEEMDYTQVESNEKKNYTIYIIIGIGILLFSVIGILGFIVYKKRH